MGKNVHKIWGWDKKKRTMIRFMKPGDIFCFRLNEDKYCFGRIIAKTVVGHIAEVFDYISEEPNIDENQVERPLRLIEPVVLDSYSLFDKKRLLDINKIIPLQIWKMYILPMDLVFGAK